MFKQTALAAALLLSATASTASEWNWDAVSKTTSGDAGFYTGIASYNVRDLYLGVYYMVEACSQPIFALIDAYDFTDKPEQIAKAKEWVAAGSNRGDVQAKVDGVPFSTSDAEVSPYLDGSAYVTRIRLIGGPLIAAMAEGEEIKVRWRNEGTEWDDDILKFRLSGSGDKFNQAYNSCVEAAGGDTWEDDVSTGEVW